MIFCTSQDVIDITGTTLDPNIIDRLIARADNKIKAMIEGAGLPAVVGATPYKIEEASIHFSSGLVLSRSIVDGTTPESLDVENTSVKSPIFKMIQEHNREGVAAVSAYIALKIDTTIPSDFKAFAVVGRGGSREGAYSVMSSSEGDET